MFQASHLRQPAGIALVPLLFIAFGCATTPKEKPPVCVGVFDSRAVACAWGRSQAFQEQVRDRMAEYKKAKARGDTKRVSELDKGFPKGQDRMNKQVFGNEPIDDILKKIEKDLPRIASLAGVHMVVSKWEIAYQKQSAKYVDVTWEMVNLFEPDEKTIKVIKDLLKHEPVPSEELDPLGRDEPPPRPKAPDRAP